MIYTYIYSYTYIHAYIHIHIYTFRCKDAYIDVEILGFLKTAIYSAFSARQGMSDRVNKPGSIRVYLINVKTHLLLTTRAFDSTPRVWTGRLTPLTTPGSV